MDLQRKINQCRMNPFIIDEEMGVYNYEIILRCITQLLQEVLPKLKEDDKFNILALKKAVETQLKNNPIHVLKKEKNYPHNKYYELKNENWETFEKWLFEYESKVRYLLDVHELNAASKDVRDGL